MTHRPLVIASLIAAASGVALSGLAWAANPAKPKFKDAARKADAVATTAKPADASKGGAPAGAGAAPSAQPVKLTAQQSQFFESKVRPVLAAHCYQCHSAEAGKSKGGLTLDTRDGVLKGGKEGPAIVLGDPDKSRLILAVSYKDADLQMPPKGEKLSDRQIADLAEWVRMGAPDPRTVAPGGAKLTGLNDKARAHWAFQPMSKPAVPQVRGTGWVRTPVDNFVLARLEAEGMRPSPPAAREALIRRAYYDMIGLPPTPEEVRAFVTDPSGNAFEKVVDRLLASPHYGERWGRYWLDTARYSDTTGAENNNIRYDYRFPYAWTYRDYVIRSFNQDKPYDQFLKEQIAADQVPGAKDDPERLAALGFLTIGKRFQNPNDQVDERIDALTKSTMALTVACARCHDHKFDPVPTADYYSLHGIFVSTVEPEERPLVGPAPSGQAFEDFKRKLTELEGRNRDIYYKAVDQLGTEFRRKAGPYLLANVLYRRNDADSIKERNRLIQEHKLERDLYQGFRIVRRDDNVFIPLMSFAQIPPEQFAARAPGVLKEVTSGFSGRRRINPLVVKAFKEAGPVKTLADVTAVYGKLFAALDPQARAYVAANRNATRPEVTGYEPALVEVLDVPTKVYAAPVLDTEKIKQVSREMPQQNNRMYQRFMFADINALELTHPGAPGRAMIVEDLERPRNSPIFIRGEAQNRGPVVPRQFLEVLSGPNRKPFTQGSGRLELANAIATRDNPLTARVMVNRIWMHHFGDGFVRTVDDMGVQSEAPVHRELLDYLASRFVEDGWSIKKLHRLILLSATYQQSSDTNKSYAEKDPDNRLYWRANLRRLDFEAIRDSMLQFTGNLDPAIGGKPVNLTEEPYSYRRSVYGYIDRGSVPELMAQFDFADPDMTNSRRTTTIVPQQALFFMNSAMSVDVARKVTSRPEFASARDDRERVIALYAVLFQRAPRPEEIKLALDFVASKQGGQAAEPRLASSKTAPGAANGKLAAASGKADPAEAAREAKRKARLDALRKQQAARPAARVNARSAIRNQGEMVERRPLTAWEQYAQALLFTNEMAYVN